MKGRTLYIRKIAAAASLATGAALALAPLAQADDFTSLVASEIASENSIFQLETTLAGVPSSDYHVVDGFDTLLTADVAKDAPTSGTPSLLDYELYGVKPFEAVVSGDSGSFNVFNGAVTKFDDALNVGLYALENKGALIPADDLFGNHISDALTVTAPDGTVSAATPTEAFQYFFNFGVGDLKGFFGDFGPAADATASADSTSLLSSAFSSETDSLNKLFELGASLTGATGDIDTTGTFDTIPVADLTNAGAPTPFDYFLFGLNPLDNSTPDPGAYDVFNGALAKFDDAINFGLYALENGGAAIPTADWGTDLFGIVGTSAATDLTGETAFQAVGTLLQDSVSDLAGYFDFSGLGGLLGSL